MQSFDEVEQRKIKEAKPFYFCQNTRAKINKTLLTVCYGLNTGRVSTGQGKVREICFFFKVSEKSGNSVKWSGKLENLQKSGKSH